MLCETSLKATNRLPHFWKPSGKIVSCQVAGTAHRCIRLDPPHGRERGTSGSGQPWNVTPALHTPLMSVTNAISSVIIVGAILAAGPGTMGLGAILGAVAVGLVAINIFGGFMVSQRMLAMFKKKEEARKP